GRAVQHDAERAVLVVVEEEDNRAVEVRVPDGGGRDQETAGVGDALHVPMIPHSRRVGTIGRVGGRRPARRGELVLDAPTFEEIRRAPKVLLHDHLDGGLRPATVVELAAEIGYDSLPTTDVDELAAWFTAG